VPSPVYLLVGFVTYLPVRLLFRLRWRGREHVPRAGGGVLAANHNSNLDPWPLGIPLFPQRHLRFMGKSELFWFPLGPFLESAGAFPVRRGEGDTTAIDTAVELCRQGEIVVMFPEGTRRQKGMLKRRQPRAHTGAARIALEAGVPLLPAAISGTDRLARLGPLRVAYGEPVDIDDLRSGDPREAAEEATQRLMAAISTLEDTLR
jgi:1-acyl-sn-glycerol-3-phosphate acyltransferase